MPARDAFLDSSVLLTQEFGLPRQKAIIRKGLRGRAKFSTQYVKTEIHRTFLKDSIFIHSLLVDEGNLTPVYQRLRQFPVTQRQKDRCFAILEHVSDKRQLRFADALTRLENLICGMEKELLKKVQMLRSGTGCELAEEELQFNDPYFSIRTSCTRKTAHCSLPTYLAQNSLGLRTLRTGISGDPHLEKLRGVLTVVMHDPEKAKGKHCRALGDTLICLDAPQDCDIFSTNVNDFDPICRFLGKSFIGIQ